MSSPWTVPVSNIVTTCARNTTTAASNSTSNPHPLHNYAMSTDSSSASGGQSGATAASSAVGLLSEVAHHQGAEPVHLGSFQRYSTFVPSSQPMNHVQQQQQQYISTQFSRNNSSFSRNSNNSIFIHNSNNSSFSRNNSSRWWMEWGLLMEAPLLQEPLSQGGIILLLPFSSFVL